MNDQSETAGGMAHQGHDVDQFRPGMRIEVTQQVPRLPGVVANKLRGTVVDYDQAQTGSWFAHAKGDRLWLDRLSLRKDDGELVMLSLDSLTHVEIIDHAAGPEEQTRNPAPID